MEQDKQWTNEVLASIKELRVPEPKHQPSTINDLKPGDIILLAPDKDMLSRNIPKADRFTRAVNHFAEGKVFQAVKTKKAPASHAVAYVKTVQGKLLFLDHTSVGSRILDEKQFRKKYGHRGMYVARPKAIIDGRELWKVAREAALKKKSDYGLFKILGGKAVCSERAGIAVAKAAGKRLPLKGKRLGPVDITPGDFFDNEANGKYFLLFPLRDNPFNVSGNKAAPATR